MLVTEARETIGVIAAINPLSGGSNRAEPGAAAWRAGATIRLPAMSGSTVFEL
jgi:hypothetical protein